MENAGATWIDEPVVMPWPSDKQKTAPLAWFPAMLGGLFLYFASIRMVACCVIPLD